MKESDCAWNEANLADWQFGYDTVSLRCVWADGCTEVSPTQKLTTVVLFDEPPLAEDVRCCVALDPPRSALNVEGGLAIGCLSWISWLRLASFCLCFTLGAII